jgi:hypothetical protein
MIDWNEMEQAALQSFLADVGPLKTGLAKFFQAIAEQERMHCAACMATVPRDPERAADHAAKAQLLDEFWAIFAEVMAQQENEPVPNQAL